MSGESCRFAFDAGTVSGATATSPRTRPAFRDPLKLAPSISPTVLLCCLANEPGKHVALEESEGKHAATAA